MRGIVIHHQKGVVRALRGRAGARRLAVSPVLALTPPRGAAPARPVTYVFYEGERVVARSSRVLLMRGRRYPDVEHWFVLPEADPHHVSAEFPQASAAPHFRASGV